MTGATGSLNKFGSALTQVMGVAGLGGLPQTALRGEQALGSLTSTGISGMNLLGGAALAGVGILAAVVTESIASYTKLGDAVLNYARVTGSSAEESGRMVQTFEALGVSEETASQGMFRLSKAIETTPEKLEALGVVIARTSTGSVDLAKTLLNVADAYNATGDQAKRNQLLFNAFGRSGKEMIPVLEQGSAALKQLEERAAMVFTPEDLERLKAEEIQMREAKQAIDALGQSLGQKLIPALGTVAESVNRGAYEQKRLNEAVAAGTITQDQLMLQSYDTSTAAGKLREEFGKQYDASQTLTNAINAQAQAANDLAAANEALWASADKVITQEEAEVNAGFALQLANLAISESQAKVDKAQEEYAAAVKKYGANSEEAQLAAGNLTRAQIDQEKAYYASAAAARKLQEDTDLVRTGQKDAALDTKVYIAKLQEEANTLAPDSPLRQRLQAYIDKLKNDIPPDVTTKFHLQFDAGGTGSHAGGHGIQAYAGGGRPVVGAPAYVGEHGPEIWTPDQPGTITPSGGTPPPAPVSGDTFTFNAPLVHAQTDADAQDIARDAAWELRRMRRTY